LILETAVSAMSSGAHIHQDLPGLDDLQAERRHL